MSAGIDQLAEEIAERAMQKLEPKLAAFYQRQFADNQDDPLLVVKEIAKELNLSEQKVRELTHSGDLKKAPGMIEIRVRRSVVRNYGK